LGNTLRQLHEPAGIVPHNLGAVSGGLGGQHLAQQRFGQLQRAAGSRRAGGAARR